MMVMNLALLKKKLRRMTIVFAHALHYTTTGPRNEYRDDDFEIRLFLTSEWRRCEREYSVMIHFVSSPFLYSNFDDPPKRETVKDPVTIIFRVSAWVHRFCLPLIILHSLKFSSSGPSHSRVQTTLNSVKQGTMLNEWFLNEEFL